MKPYRLLLLTLSVSILSCTGNNRIETPEDTREVQIAPISLAKAESEAAEIISDFSFELFRKVYSSHSEADLLISPLSVAMDLSMIAGGMTAEAKEIIAKLIGIEGLPSDVIESYYQKLCKGLSAVDADSRLCSANSAWFDDGTIVDNSYKTALESTFEAYVNTLDFQKLGSADIINGWCYDKTGGMIEEIVGAETLRSLQALILNAIYFNARWAFEMQLDGDVLNTEGEFKYAETEQFRMLSLPFGNGCYEMLVALPVGQFSQMVNSLSSSEIKEMKPAMVRARIPKFRTGTSVDLTKDLVEMGLATGASRFDIGTIMQKTCFEANEKGAQAAAITGGMITSPGEDPEWIEFDASNRSFLYMIYENSSSSVIFIGCKKD